MDETTPYCALTVERETGRKYYKFEIHYKIKGQDFTKRAIGKAEHSDGPIPIFQDGEEWISWL